MAHLEEPIGLARQLEHVGGGVEPLRDGLPGCGDQAKPVAQRYLIYWRERADMTSSPKL